MSGTWGPSANSPQGPRYPLNTRVRDWHWHGIRLDQPHQLVPGSQALTVALTPPPSPVLTPEPWKNRIYNCYVRYFVGNCFKQMEKLRPREGMALSGVTEPGVAQLDRRLVKPLGCRIEGWSGAETQWEEEGWGGVDNGLPGQLTFFQGQDLLGALKCCVMIRAPPPSLSLSTLLSREGWQLVVVRIGTQVWSCALPLPTSGSSESGVWLLQGELGGWPSGCCTPEASLDCTPTLSSTSPGADVLSP